MVFRRVSFFVIEEVIVIVIVSITIDLLQRFVYIGIAGRVCLIVATVEKAVEKMARNDVEPLSAANGCAVPGLSGAWSYVI